MIRTEIFLDILLEKIRLAELLLDNKTLYLKNKDLKRSI